MMSYEKAKRNAKHFKRLIFMESASKAQVKILVFVDCALY